MISVHICRGAETQRRASLEELKAALQDPVAVVWADVFPPEPEDWRTLQEVFGFHALALEDAQSQHQRARLESFEDYLFMSVRLCLGNPQDTDTIPHMTDETDIFLGANYLVTIHRKDTISIDSIRLRWEERAPEIAHTSAFSLYMVLDHIVDSFYPALDGLNDALDEIETQVYLTRQDVEIAPALALKRRLLLLRQTVAPTRDVMNQLLQTRHSLIPETTRLYFQDIYDHTLHLTEQVDLYRDMLAGVLDAILAQTSNHLNQIMKRMTAIATILTTLTLVSSVYGMNFVHMPELQWRYGYGYSLGLMGFLAVALTLFFRKIKWF